MWEPEPPGNLQACNRPVQRLLCLYLQLKLVCSGREFIYVHGLLTSTSSL